MKKLTIFAWLFIPLMIFWLIADNGRLLTTMPRHTIVADDSETAVYLPLITNPEQLPQIIQFTVDKELTDPGATIELSWETAYAITNTLYLLSPDGRLSTFWYVESTGTMSYTIPTQRRNDERFILFASNNTAWTSHMVTVTLNCPYEWFFAPAPGICAQDAPLISAAAEQSFEHGTMIWVQEENSITVLFDGEDTPRYSIFMDEWEEGDPIDDPSIMPPTGFYQPINGFGKVWREQPAIRDRLGWATTTEVGFETAVQRTSYAKYNDIYILASNNNIWHLLAERSGWEKIIPD